MFAPRAPRALSRAPESRRDVPHDDVEIQTRRVRDVVAVDMVGGLDSRTCGPASTGPEQDRAGA